MASGLGMPQRMQSGVQVGRRALGRVSGAGGGEEQRKSTLLVGRGSQSGGRKRGKKRAQASMSRQPSFNRAQVQVSGRPELKGLVRKN